MTSKMLCKSDDNNITIMYNNDTITGYTAKGISNEIAEIDRTKETSYYLIHYEGKKL